MGPGNEAKGSGTVHNSSFQLKLTIAFNGKYLAMLHVPDSAVHLNAANIADIFAKENREKSSSD